MSFAHKVVAWVMQQQGYLTLPYLRGPLGYQLLILPYNITKVNRAL